MTGSYLLDEHLPTWWPATILKAAPALKVWAIGDPGAPPLQAPDPLILEWCEANDFILVTNNRKSMPRHLADHVALGRHIPGILVMNPALPIGELLDELVLIAGASDEHEYRDLILYLPLT